MNVHNISHYYGPAETDGTLTWLSTSRGGMANIQPPSLGVRPPSCSVNVLSVTCVIHMERHWSRIQDSVLDDLKISKRYAGPEHPYGTMEWLQSFTDLILLHPLLYYSYHHWGHHTSHLRVRDRLTHDHSIVGLLVRRAATCPVFNHRLHGNNTRGEWDLVLLDCLHLCAMYNLAELITPKLPLPVTLPLTPHHNLSPFHAAACHDALEVMDALWDAGYSGISAPDHFGNTPLHLATYSQQIRVTETLLLQKSVSVEAKRDIDRVAINAQNASGSTPLMNAVSGSGGYSEAVGLARVPYATLAPGY